jgi:glycosyltransferase involved in cell wall biosynthesis
VRILYLITTPDHGGAQVNVLDLLSGWSGGVETILATGADGFLTEEARALGVEVRLVPELIRPVRPVRDWQAYRAVRRLIRAVQPDLVHCHSSKAGLLGRLASRAEGVPVVFTVHGWAFEQGISLPWRITGLLSEHIASRFCRNQHIITVAEADRTLAIRKRVQPPERMTTVHNGIADVPFRAEPGEGNPPLIIMVARFSQQKDHDTLLKAMAAIDAPWNVSFVGDGPRLEIIRQLADELGIADRIDFLGNRRDVPELLAGADIFVLSSLWEGFPISILEAMRAGLPVVASDVGGANESVIHEETGFLTRPKDIDGLRERIKRLLDEPELRLRMGNEGRRLFEERFGKRKMLEETASVYGKLLDNAPTNDMVKV